MSRSTDGRRRSLLVGLRVCAVAGFVAFVLAGCGGSSDPTTEAAGEDPGQGSAATGAYPDVEGVLGTADGGQFSFGDLEGRPALLWFWAPW